MNKTVKCIIWAIVIAFLCYNSIYFKKLSEVKAAEQTFNAVKYAANMLKNRLPETTAKAPDIDELLTALKASPSNTFSTYGKALAIGSTKYFLIKGTAEVTEVGESDVKITTTGHNTMQIATEYIFGNAVRDASGLVNLNDFSNTLDLSNISSEVNRLIREKVIPPFKSVVKKGDKIEFTGAIALNEVHLNTEALEVTPISLKILP